MSEMTASDVALLSGNDGMNNWMNNPFIYLVFLMLWRNGFGIGDSATQGALTRAELSDGLNFQSLDSAVRGVQESISGVDSTIQAVGANLSDKFCSGIYGVTNAINQSAYQNQLGICGIERSIDGVRYDDAKNTCAITTAIREDGEKTRALLVEQQIQNLRDINEATQRELQSAQLTLANANQTQNLLGNLGRYVPYASNSCGCGYSW